MPRGLSDISNFIQTDGQNIVLDFTRVSDTSATVKWSIPKNSKAYNGILITASVQEINPSNYPTDGVRYQASQNLSSPANKIGLAQVVGAFYNDLTTSSLELSGLDANEVYFLSAHLISNVNTYYTIGVRSYSPELQSEIYAGDITKSYSPPENPSIGDVYFDENQNIIFSFNGSNWEKTTTHTTPSYDKDPLPNTGQRIGDFYYNTRTRTLKIWTGPSGWIDAEKHNNGVPMYNKQDVGTDLTYDGRANLIDILKHQLGYPTVCVELNENHFNIGIDNALMEYRRRADNAYFQQFFTLTMLPQQEKYYLNDPSLGTAKIVDVLKVHRLNFAGFGGLTAFGPDPVYAQSFLNQIMTPHAGYDLVSVHLVHSLSKMHTLLFAGEIGFNWREAPRELTLFRRVYSAEKVLIECSCEKTEQELLQDRWAQQWIQQWAEAEVMMILGRIRGKFSSLPGPGGSMSLNADSLISDAKEMQADCLRQISDFETGQNGPGGFQNTSFVIG